MGEASTQLRQRVGLRARELGRRWCPVERAELARVAGRTLRTIRNWKRKPGGGRRGRPPHSLEEKDRARRLVLAELRIQGFTAHGRAIERGLEGRGVPRRLIRASVREIKATIERDAEAYREERMIRIEVPFAGVVTAIDTTHVTREPPDDRAIQALIAVDVATTLKLGFKVLHSPRGTDVIELLVAIKVARGAYPLVLMSDNGPENVNAAVAAFLEENRIVHLRNVPHTPRHNPAVERAHREVKAEAALGMAVMDPATPVFERVRASIAQAVHTLNNGRLRESRGWKTAAQLDTELRAPYALVDRDVFYGAASAAARAARSIPGSARDKRLAERWATLRIMEAFGLIKLFRGGVPLTVIEAERVT
jgi:transposase InsO family protein